MDLVISSRPNPSMEVCNPIEIYTLSLLHHWWPLNPLIWRSMEKYLSCHPQQSSLEVLDWNRCSKKIGSGSSSYFWHDLWLGAEPLKIKFPKIFSITTFPAATIQNCGFWDGGRWLWTFSWNKSLRRRDICEKLILDQLLSQVSLDPNNDDHRVWSFDKFGYLSTKSLIFELAKSTIPQNHDIIKGLWKCLVPHQIKVFIWTTLLNRINTCHKLLKMGLIDASETFVPFVIITPSSGSPFSPLWILFANYGNGG